MAKIVINFILLLITLTILIIIIEVILVLKTSNNNFANTKNFQNKYVIPNSHGYRDKEYSYKKPKNIYLHILL